MAEQTIRDYVFSLSDEDFEELLFQARNRFFLRAELVLGFSVSHFKKSERKR